MDMVEWMCTDFSDGNEPGSAGLQARARRGFARLDTGSGSEPKF